VNLLRRNRIGVGAAALLAGMAPFTARPAAAALLAEETFDYPADSSLDGQGGGAGWGTNRWLVTGNAGWTNRSPGLSVTGVLACADNRAKSPTGSSGTSTAGRAAAPRRQTATIALVATLCRRRSAYPQPECETLRSVPIRDANVTPLAPSPVLRQTALHAPRATMPLLVQIVLWPPFVECGDVTLPPRLCRMWRCDPTAPTIPTPNATPSIASASQSTANSTRCRESS
jgi:hypothetical protein